MIVVADASPLNYLIQIESANILHALFGRVLVPAAVMEELRHSRAPSEVKSWLLQIPSWIEVRARAAPPEEALQILDPGEREAILLAQEMHADLPLIDEKQGRLEAKRRGITTTGTLGCCWQRANRACSTPNLSFSGYFRRPRSWQQPRSRRVFSPSAED
jgi:predicted nucleic acid-binding protein